MTALRAQFGPDGHTHDCTHMRAWGYRLDCCGPCVLAREALRLVGLSGAEGADR